MNKPLIDETIKALRTNVETLSRKRDEIDLEMAGVLAIIDEWQEALHIEDNLDGPPPQAKPKRERMKTGQARESIAAYFLGYPTAHKSVQELSAAIGLNPSTVAAVLAKSGKYQKTGTKWGLKNPPEQGRNLSAVDFTEPQGTLEESGAREGSDEQA